MSASPQRDHVYVLQEIVALVEGASRNPQLQTVIALAGEGNHGLQYFEGRLRFYYIFYHPIFEIYSRIALLALNIR